MLHNSNLENEAPAALANDVAKAVGRYLHQLRAITMIRILNPLIIASQQYRGTHIALIDGAAHYQNKLAGLSDEIDKRIISLELVNREFSKPLTKVEIAQLRHEWFSVKGWSDGNALETFKLHSHFIEQQIKMVWNITEKAGFFTSIFPRSNEDPESAVAQEEYFRGKLLVQFVMRELPELIEILARIRGLATHASVVGYCDDEHYSILEALLRSLNHKTEKFRSLSKSLQIYVINDVPALIDMEIHDIKIVQFSQTINRNILNSRKIDLGCEDIFNMATEIIAPYSLLINEILGFIRRKIFSHFDRWHVPSVI